MKALTSRITAKRYLELGIVALVLGAYVVIAGQRLSTVPLPDTDEAYTLQVPYEMLTRGKLAMPMWRYLGGNIENSWHSYTPVYFLLLAGFHKLFGLGLTEGRAFNLITAVLVLLMTYLIGRRLFNWRVGLIAISLLIADQTFFERSRLLRNDFAPAFFAMLAFYLFEKAEGEKRLGYYVASGLAAGAGVMCHTNALYMLGGIGLLMLLKEGWRVIKQKKLYWYVSAALAVMAYEIVYDVIDYNNFLLQNRDDKLHFDLFERWGFLRNLIGETRRYETWSAGGQMFLNVPRTTLHIFQFLAAAAIIYLIIYTVIQIKRGGAIKKPAVRLFVISAVAILFHGLIVSAKGIYYLAHLAPWLALGVGVMLNEVISFGARFDLKARRGARLIRWATCAAAALLALGFIAQTARQYRRYLREATNPQLARFDEIKDALRSAVPDGVCPVSIKAPVFWLAFPEHDRCFATIQNRMKEALDMEGNEYAILVPSPNDQTRRSWTEEFDQKYPLLATLEDTAYGTINIYYTGTNPEYRARPTQKISFFGDRRGHVTAEQLAGAREIWSANADQLSLTATGSKTLEDGCLVLQPPRHAHPIELSKIDLKPNTAYEFEIHMASIKNGWQFLVLDDRGESILQRVLIEPGASGFKGLFASRGASARLAVQYFGWDANDALRVDRIILREIGER